MGWSGVLVPVQVLDELDDAALVLEDLLARRLLLRQRDLDALVQERQLAQPVGQDVPLELRASGRSCASGIERDLRAGALGLADRLQLATRCGRARSAGGRRCRRGAPRPPATRSAR